MKFGIGQAVPRTEDARLLTGGGRYTDDVSMPGQAYLFVLRSPHAQAAIRSIDVSAARQAPGVFAVYTVEDLKADGIGNLPHRYALKQRDGSPLHEPPRPALADGMVRHVGDPVAVVIGETIADARDAAELIDVDYEMMNSVAGTAAALHPGAALVWPDVPNNQCFDWEKGDEKAADEGFAKAAHVASLEIINNRVSPNPMEPRGTLAAVDQETGRMTIYISSQGVHGLRNQLAKFIFNVPEDQIRVMTTDVGGGFGMKIFMYPEYVLALYAARKLNRPVKWIGDRAESFVSDDHGRDNVTRIDLALDKDGKFLAMKVDTIANLGAYLSNMGAFIPTDAGSRMFAGVYTTPAIHIRVRGAFTNTNPVDAYRGAGRPEAAYAIERLIDHAAHQIGLTPAEIRRRNFIPPGAMPYTQALGLVYDSGNFAQNMEDALKIGDWDGFEQRRRQARARNKYRGIGLSTYIEACAGGGAEQATLEVGVDGKITLLIGTQTNGQGHETAYKQIVADRLGVEPEDITVVQGDSDRITFGGGTGGSRSVPVGGAAIAEAAVAVIEKAKAKAADLLEAAPVDVEFADGSFSIVGTDRRVSFQEVARQAGANDGALAFNEAARWQPPAPTFPNGCHICEIEIDGDTGVPEIVRYTVVDDFGKVINPAMVAGQVHGGVAQGVGQALYENCVYDEESGQLITGSFMDYCMPRADHVPFLEFKMNEVLCTTNALGMKGAGEAGSIGAPPAVINAVVDALREFGVEHVDMPATPEKLWKIIHAHDQALAAE